MYRRTSKTTDRVLFTTSISNKLLIAVKNLAINEGKRVNDLIEEALKNYYKL